MISSASNYALQHIWEHRCGTLLPSAQLCCLEYIQHMHMFISTHKHRVLVQLAIFEKVQIKSRSSVLTHLVLVPHCFHTSQDRPGRRSKMSWMDSWSRPSKHQATPAPFYLTPGGEATPYCHSCGRVISSRRTDKTTGTTTTADTENQSTVVKYCSSRCRSHKPGKLDREIESVFVGFLNGTVEGAGRDGEQGSGSSPKREKAFKGKKGAAGGGGGKKNIKGDVRILVSCDEVERHIFGRENDGDTAGSASSGSQHGDEETHADPNGHGDSHPALNKQTANPPYDDHSTGTLEDPTSPTGHIDGDILARMAVRSGTRIRPPQSVSEVNGSVGGEKGRAERIEETETMLEKRREGLRRARHREMVRCAARRGVVFGFGFGEENRKCEAVMLGKVVEPSFAKGDWSIRWRE